MTDDRWPALPYADWKDTLDTLHMWAQVVGKIALASAPPLNHCWGSALHLTARGLATPPLTHGDRTFAIAFDFASHRLRVEASDGETRTLALEPRTVAAFHAEVMRTLGDMGLAVKIWPMPVEIGAPIRFTDDTVHRSYDPVQAHRFWEVLLKVERLLTAARCRFIGKASPANFYWGSFDLALTRFSGRPAPPRDGPAFMRDAYSHEVISHGFWPGNEQLPEAAFYAYAVPEPDGLKDAPVEPAGAYYHREMGEFILPYEVVRRSSSPEQAVIAFVESTYAQAATLAQWDRAALERGPSAGPLR